MKTKTITNEANTHVKEPAFTFFGALFDFSFSRFITIQMFPVIYGIVLATTIFGILYLSVEAFLISAPRGLFYLFVAGPLSFLVIATVTRAIMEFYLVMFKIAENIDDMCGVAQNFSGIGETVGGVKDLTRRLPFWSVKSPKESQPKEPPKKKRKDVDWPY